MYEMKSKQAGLSTVFVWWLVAGMTAFCAEQETDKTINEAITLALENNGTLRAAALEIERAAVRLRWAGRLQRPELSLGISDDALGEGEGEGAFEIGFNQAFPITSRLRMEKDLRAFQLELAEKELAGRRRLLANEVVQSAIRLSVGRHEVAQQQRLVDLNQEIVDFLIIQLDRGETSALDVAQARMNGAAIKQHIRGGEAVVRQRTLELNRLMGLKAPQPFVVSYDLGLPADAPGSRQALAEILSDRPDYQLAVAKIQEASLSAALAQTERWDDVSVGLSVERESATDAPDGLEENTLLGLSVSIPLPFGGKGKEASALAAVDEKLAEAEVETLRFLIESEYEEAFLRRLDAYQLASEISGELLGLAEANFDDLRKAYEQGQAELLQVQKAQEQLLEFKSIELEALAAYHAADAHMRFVTGEILNEQDLRASNGE